MNFGTETQERLSAMPAIEKRVLVARKKAENEAKGLKRKYFWLTEAEAEKVKKYILKLRT